LDYHPTPAAHTPTHMPEAPGELLTIVVPVFNEEATIGAVAERLQSISLPVTREIVIVNDGSRDGTRAALDDIARRFPAMVVLHAPENRGKGHAVRMGIQQARGTIVAIQDADLELDPADLGSLVTPILNQETTVVYGSRFLSGQAARGVGYAANRALTSLTNLLFGGALTDMETCYKIMRTDVARSLELSADRFDIEPEITAQLFLRGHRILERPVTYTPRSRAAGKKIGWRDGVAAIAVLVRQRLKGRRAAR
jgi:glycosyltransferase involved in cell wall biosynthesis